MAPAIIMALKASERFSLSAGLAPIAAARLGVVIEELVSNTLRHGAESRDITVEFVLSEAAGQVRIELTDNGAPFDPTAEREFDGPDRDSGGGVGLALIRAWAYEASYARESGRNHVRITLPSSK